MVRAEPYAASVSIDAILDQEAFTLDKILQTRPSFLEDTDHVHDPGVKSVGLVVEEALDADKVHLLDPISIHSCQSDG